MSKKNGFIVCFIIALSLLMSNTVFADEPLKDTFSKKYMEAKDVCSLVKQVLREGMNAKEVTKRSIELGHDACLVIRCAVEGNGSLQQIMAGALEAGATSDVCSKCAIEAGADPKDIAQALETGLGYTPAATGLNPINVNVPGGEPAGGILSSSHF
jgi:hypothetical protein